ncbi:hypothetical protein [Caenimonas aquaedulcis]|uniref:Entry exclusion lipoprotein TrbK n=1 Tax=Caenimonas aquaedulcis TaxID=2793270 RepID=A0A931H476_9BURK|nr:hypothetical protein [Caenimonas aquaedulcis]MBG9388311.1 hypothetical protein [Caenimonas aquaedulcis]
MKNLLLIAAATLLAACASPEPMTPQQSSERAACRNTDAPTGSNLVRRSECAPQAAAPIPTQKN